MAVKESVWQPLRNLIENLLFDLNIDSPTGCVVSKGVGCDDLKTKLCAIQQTIDVVLGEEGLRKSCKIRLDKKLF